MRDPRFIHLRVCSDFSLSHGLAKVSDLVKRVASLQMPAMALTDFTNLFGLVKFYDSAHSAGIKPIIGAEFLLQCEALGGQLCPLTVLAANNQGYYNLTQLISRAYLRGHIRGAPAIDRQWLITHKAGVILLSGGPQGDIGALLLRERTEEVAQCIAFYQQHFPHHYYLEISRTGEADEVRYLQAVLPLAASSRLPVVATHPVYFIHPEEFEAHEIRVAIHHGYTLNDPQRPKKQGVQQHYLCSAEEMCERFADIPAALVNSVEIAKRCNVTLQLGNHFMPQFPTGEMTTEAYLVQQAERGLNRRLVQLFPEEAARAKKQPVYSERLTRELTVINQMGFPGYFLIVMEFIQWSKQQGIPVGPGRGSGPGSLVAYALQITDIDPLAFDLLFERFLNSERVSLPDFDIDFCMERRDQVIEHVADRYGHKAVSQIITFGTMAAKAAIRDVGRALGHPYGFVDRIAKLVPLELGITLEKALLLEPQLAHLYEQDEEVQTLVNMACKLEGVVRNAGKHAGGVVIAPTQITDFAPLYCDPHGQHPVTQFDKSDVEYIGLVKFDFLGLRTLTIIHAALQSINTRRLNADQSSAECSPVDISAISLTDAKSFSLLKSGQTTAVFQLESRGMKELIKRLQPDSFEEIIALLALFRPGPLQSGMVDNFIDRKQGRETVAYPDRQYQHPLLRPILEPTYGIILYQEQVMQIAQVLAGYTLGEADLLRRAMGKKDAEEMAEQRHVFEQGAKNNGIEGALAVKIFDLMEKFAGYGFNKSHSAAYALLSYQTLWLKSHFPADFMAAVMSADLDHTDKIVGLVEECHRMGLTVLPPDINRSDYGFSVTSKDEVVYGLGAVKGVGSGAVETIVAARSQRPFADLYDLCARTDSQRLNRRSLEKLIMAGALDSLTTHRAALIAMVEGAIKQAEQYTRAEQQGQADMFGLLVAPSRPLISALTGEAAVPKWSERERLANERQTLGLYLTGHPITQYLPELKHYIQHRLQDLKPTSRDQLICTAGLVMASRVVSSKRGTRMGLLTLDDGSARLEAILYSDTLTRYRTLLEKDRLLVVTGSVTVDGFSDGLKMVVHELKEIQAVRANRLRGLTLQLNEQQMDVQFCHRLQQILGAHCVKAGTSIEVDYRQAKGRANLRLGQAWQVSPTDSLLAALRQLVGDEQVILQFD